MVKCRKGLKEYMIYGPQFNHNIHRIQPIDPDRQDDDQRDGRKRRVLHQGREWAESEDNDLPLQPSIPQNPPPPRMPRTSAGVYADKILLERAQALFSQLTTIEEKAAQLCFLVTEAIYDATLQRQVELLIQTWQIGGILYQKGEYRRQAYLIEKHQEVSKTPLLFANDYLHGLSFYLQGDSLPKNALSEQHSSDMGKAVMVLNRGLGVHVQFDRERGKERSTMSEEQAKAFRKGIRGAQGIVGKEKAPPQQQGYSQPLKGPFPFYTLKGGSIPTPLISEYQVQETIGFKTLTFFDATHIDKGRLDEELLGAFKLLYDVFLLGGNITEGIRSISRLVRSGKIREEALDRHVMKALIIKSLFFKS
jgi:hypothetical protein